SWQRALDAARAVPGEEALFFEGLIQAARGDDAAAAATFRRKYSAAGTGLQRFAELPDAPEALATLARTQRDARAFTDFLRAHDTASARAAYDRLVARDPDWARRGDAPWESLVSVAELHAAEGDRAAALTAYQDAIDRVEARRSLLTADSLKRNFVDTSTIHAMYVGAAQAALDTDPARAFSLVERGRARALLDLASDRSSGATAWRAYNAQSALLHNLLAREHARPRPDADEIARLRGRLAEVEAARPIAAGRGVLEPSAAVATLDAVAAALPAD